jgi:ATP-dependent protease HslVU (ClpYQ) peptidase subunit
MTCIIGLKDGENVYIGSDSQHSRANIKLRNNSSKIFQKGPFTIAGAGSARGMQLMIFGTDMTDIDLECDEHQLVIELANELQTANRQAKHYKLDDGVERGESYFLVAINNRLFCIEFNYYVHEIEDFIAIGNSADCAEGVLSYIQKYDSSLDPEEKIIRALEFTENHDMTISGPFKVIGI